MVVSLLMLIIINTNYLLEFQYSIHNLLFITFITICYSSPLIILNTVIRSFHWGQSTKRTNIKGNIVIINKVLLQ